MGHTAERIVRRYQISREAQDAFALLSHQKAVAAQRDGRFDGELIPVAVAENAGAPTMTERVFAADEGPRRDTSAEALAKLKPAFDAQGTITAGNTSQISDGAAAVVLMDGGRARTLGLRPLGRLVAYAVTGCLPEEMGLGPISAIPKALDLDPQRINVNGGAIALGHPLGATGAKLAVTLLAEMRRRQERYGMVAMCVGGGMGAAAVFELL
jgi:acetyl-CoA acyltransferase